jgi:hypothetical protein
VGQLLRILHGMGLVAGMVALAVLALAPAWGIYKPRAVLAPMVLLVVMIAATVYSQFGIIPAMERDRMAAGGAIDTADATDPTTIHFNKLHKRSELVEETVLLLGLATVVLIPWTNAGLETRTTAGQETGATSAAARPVP